jgi:hypothetical protein
VTSAAVVETRDTNDEGVDVALVAVVLGDVTGAVVVVVVEVVVVALILFFREEDML